MQRPEITRKSHQVGDFTLSEIFFPPHLHLARHVHDSAGIGLTLRGSVVEAFGHHGVVCTPQTVLTRPSHEAHVDRVSASGAKVFIVEASESWIAHVREHGMILNEPQLHAPGDLTRLLRGIRHEAQRRDAASPLAIQSLMFEIASHLVREATKDARGPAPAWLRRVKDKLDAHFAEKLMLTDLAREAGIHSVHLARRFRQCYAMSVGEYVRRRRIQAAIRDIENDAGSLASIALEAGFSSQAHFCRTFKQVTGKTPTEIRRSKR